MYSYTLHSIHEDCGQTGCWRCSSSEDLARTYSSKEEQEQEQGQGQDGIRTYAGGRVPT